MARTDVKKAKEATWVKAEMEEYNDERYLMLPSTRESTQYVSDKSQVNEWRKGQMTRETDNNVFTVQWLKKHLLDWEGVGIVHESGEIEDPAACTLDNRVIIMNARGLNWLLHLQELSRELGLHATQERDTQRDNFRQAHDVSGAQSGSELTGMPAAGDSR